MSREIPLVREQATPIPPSRREEVSSRSVAGSLWARVAVLAGMATSCVSEEPPSIPESPHVTIEAPLPVPSRHQERERETVPALEGFAEGMGVASEDVERWMRETLPPDLIFGTNITRIRFQSKDLSRIAPERYGERRQRSTVVDEKSRVDHMHQASSQYVDEVGRPIEVVLSSAGARVFGSDHVFVELYHELGHDFDDESLDQFEAWLRNPAARLHDPYTTLFVRQARIRGPQYVEWRQAAREDRSETIRHFLEIDVFPPGVSVVEHATDIFMKRFGHPGLRRALVRERIEYTVQLLDTEGGFDWASAAVARRAGIERMAAQNQRFEISHQIFTRVSDSALRESLSQLLAEPDHSETALSHEQTQQQADVLFEQFRHRHALIDQDHLYAYQAWQDFVLTLIRARSHMESGTYLLRPELASAADGFQEMWRRLSGPVQAELRPFLLRCATAFQFGRIDLPKITEED